jgi:hypothetical protein
MFPAAERAGRSSWRATCFQLTCCIRQGSNSEPTARASSSRVQYLPGLIHVEEAFDGVYRYGLGHEFVETGFLSRGSIFGLAIAGNCDHTY